MLNKNNNNIYNNQQKDNFKGINFFYKKIPFYNLIKQTIKQIFSN